MKITLTKPQLIKLLAKFLKVEVDDVEVTGAGIELAAMFEREIKQFAYQTHQKISAIKKLRELSGAHLPQGYHADYYGLGDSKHAIENFESFLAFIREHNRLPKSVSSGGNCS